MYFPSCIVIYAVVYCEYLILIKIILVFESTYNFCVGIVVKSLIVIQ